MTARSRKLIVATVVWVVALALLALLAPYTEPNERNLTGLVGDVQRGAYVARTAACITCHTDVRTGGAVLAGGPPIETPFGTFFAPNITPDRENGIGQWTVEDFARALTHGEGPNGQSYLPVFPYPFFERLTDQDIVDLWAAVNSVPAAAQASAEHLSLLPNSIDLPARLWRSFFFDPPGAVRSNGENDPLMRGEYLVKGPAHCGACHTPRNLMGARLAAKHLQGGESSKGEKAPPIDARSLKENGWTNDDLVFALRSGLMPDGDSFGGSMARVVNGGTRYWTEQDLQAVAEYLNADQR